LLLIQTAASAQNFRGEITGRLMDRNNEPLSSVNIVLFKCTDLEGNDLPDLLNGNDTIFNVVDAYFSDNSVNKFKLEKQNNNVVFQSPCVPDWQPVTFHYVRIGKSVPVQLLRVGDMEGYFSSCRLSHAVAFQNLLDCAIVNSAGEPVYSDTIRQFTRLFNAENQGSYTNNGNILIPGKSSDSTLPVIGNMLTSVKTGKNGEFIFKKLATGTYALAITNISYFDADHAVIKRFDESLRPPLIILGGWPFTIKVPPTKGIKNIGNISMNTDALFKDATITYKDK
jgi:hypothetical protein